MTTTAPARTRRWSVPTRATSALGRELAIYLAAVGVIALHVVDDAFLQPEPGTAAADHLFSGLVPLAAMVLSTVVYGRLRAGCRAVLSLGFGAFGVIIGACEAGYHTYKVGPSGDDFTGLAAMAAGVLLIGAGIVTLWASRRLDDPLWRRYLRRSLLFVVGAVAALQVGGAIALAYGATHILRPDVPAADLGVPYENVSFETTDGLELDGWYIPSRNAAAVIAFPGRSGPQAHARMLVRHGYGVLMFDRRGEGSSDGDGNLFGWGGDQDIHAAVEYLKSRDDVDPARIGGIGFSVGGELMLQAAAQSSGLAAVVSEGAGTRTLAEDLQDIPSPDKWLGLPFLAAKTGAVALFSNTAPPPSLTDLVPRIGPTPVLLIWSPTSGGENMNPAYHRLAGESAQIWAMPDAEHVRGIYAQPGEYERRVVGFFDRALLGPPPA